MTDNNNIIIQILNCSASYDKEEILHDVSLSVMEGEFIVLIGPSGCGKTTLLKTINGLVSPINGDVTVNGNNLKSCDIISLRKEIGYAVQGAKLFPHMTVTDNICYVPSLNGNMTEDEKKQLTETMLSLVRLPLGLANRFPKQLSGGQKQRVGIARALASHPKILLMDEPFGAVDEITRKELQEELISLQQETGVTIIFITHDIREAVKLGKRIIVMKDGAILQDGTAKELMKAPTDEFVRKLFIDFN